MLVVYYVRAALGIAEYNGRYIDCFVRDVLAVCSHEKLGIGIIFKYFYYVRIEVNDTSGVHHSELNIVNTFGSKISHVSFLFGVDVARLQKWYS